MSKNFIPHYSELPEERYLLEVATMEKPVKPNSANYREAKGSFIGHQYSADVHHWHANTEIYKAHLAQLKKYPMQQSINLNQSIK